MGENLVAEIAKAPAEGQKAPADRISRRAGLAADQVLDLPLQFGVMQDANVKVKNGRDVPPIVGLQVLALLLELVDIDGC